MSFTSLRRRAVGLTALTAALAGVVLAAPAGAAAPAADPTLTVKYDAVGSSHIGSINANLPISKTSLQTTLNLNNYKIVGGTLPVAPQVVSFTALGFIPLRATTTLIQAAPITGSLTPTDNGNILKSTVKYTIKLSKIQVNFLGQWIDLGVGNNCQTISPIVVQANSPAGKYFDIFQGGKAVGKYTIGQFQNCAPLHLPDLFGVGSLAVNALVPGSNNTISITLSNGQFVSGT